jgi:hypothetical protein
MLTHEPHSELSLGLRLGLRGTQPTRQDEVCVFKQINKIMRFEVDKYRRDKARFIREDTIFLVSSL